MDKYLYSEWTSSHIFDSSWFGTASPKNDDHRIGDASFWANVKFPSGAAYSKWNIKTSQSLNPFVNAYGYLRSPWNNNPVEGICRSNSTYGYTMANSLPSCDVFKSCFQSKTLAEVNLLSCLDVLLLNLICFSPTTDELLSEWGHPWARAHHDRRCLGRSFCLQESQHDRLPSEGSYDCASVQDSLAHGLHPLSRFLL